MTTLIQLLVSFTIIGFTSFGGLSMVPLISSEMISHGWMTAEEVIDIVAIAEMTPGPLGLNCATFAGMRTAGIPGALAANLGILMPSITFTMIVGFFFEKFEKSNIMQHILTGVRPACIGLVAGIIVTMSLSNYFAQGAVSIKSVLIGLVDLVLLKKFKLSIPITIFISAALGLIAFGTF